MGPDLQTCGAMVQACREAGVPFLIHENFRWLPPLRAIRTALDEGWIGRPFLARIQMSSGPEESYTLQPFLRTLRQPALTDMGSHIFDLARFYLGEAESVYCQTHRSLEILSGPNIFTAMVRCGEALCVCEVGCRVGTQILMEGPKGTLDLGEDLLLRIRADGREIARDCRLPAPYAWEDPEMGAEGFGHAAVRCHRHLVECLRSGKPAETSAEESLKTMRLMFAAIESAETRSVVAL